MKRRNSSECITFNSIHLFYIAKNPSKVKILSFIALNSYLRTKFCQGYVPDVLIGREKYHEELFKHLEQTIENKQNNRY